MGRQTPIATPTLAALFKNLGENIRLARTRRNISTVMLSERAGISRMTLYSIENGNPNVSIAAYGNVLFCLGLEKEIGRLGRDDEFGRRLQDAKLTIKSAGKTKKS